MCLLINTRTLVILGVLQVARLPVPIDGYPDPKKIQSYKEVVQSHNEHKLSVVPSGNEVYNGESKRVNHEIMEKKQFNDLLTEAAAALRKADPKLKKNLILVADKIERIERAAVKPKGFRKLYQFREHLFATIVEWIHFLEDHENEVISEAKLKSLNNKIYNQFQENRDLALQLISELAEKSLSAGLSASEQMTLLNMFVENGAIERIKSIALHEMARQLNFDIPGDKSILKSIAGLMVEKVFEAKYHEIEKKMIKENERSSAVRKVRSVAQNEADQKEPSEKRDSSGTHDLKERKISKHVFKTRKHGDRKLTISEVPIADDAETIKETISLDVEDTKVPEQKENNNDNKEKLHISLKEEKELVPDNQNEKTSGVLKGQRQGPYIENEGKAKPMTESDITQKLIPKFQAIYSDDTLDSKMKDQKMIQMITDMMSNPKIQESIISLLENHLKKMDVRMATHLVLMGMKRTSFGSDEDVLEEMFDTWEPFLSKTIGLLDIDSLVKICAIHASVEKVATPEQQLTLRSLTKKVLDGLPDRTMARHIEKGMSAALSGNDQDVLNALEKDEPNDAKVEKKHAPNDPKQTQRANKDVNKEHGKQTRINLNQGAIPLTSDTRVKNPEAMKIPIM